MIVDRDPELPCPTKWERSARRSRSRTQRAAVNGKRRLSIKQIKRVREQFGIPANLLRRPRGYRSRGGTPKRTAYIMRDEGHKHRSDANHDIRSPLPIQRLDLEIDHIANGNCDALLELVRRASARRPYTDANQELVRVGVHQIALNATAGMRNVIPQRFTEPSDAGGRELHAHVMARCRRHRNGHRGVLEARDWQQHGERGQQRLAPLPESADSRPYAFSNDAAR
jgi:hypothetical protein